MRRDDLNPARDVVAGVSRDAASRPPVTQGRVVLEVHDLRSGYGHVPVLHGVTLQLHESEALGIVGHNGMGKTTLLKTIIGLLPACGGRIAIDGVDVSREPPYARSRRGLGYVAQGRGILPALTARENLRLAWTGATDEAESEAVERVVRLFPRLERLLDRRGGALSGGEQQLLALARALVSNPWALLLDEPSEGIQPSIVDEIGQTLSRLRGEHGLAILIVEQNLDLVLDVANRIAVMEKGRLVREFGAEQIGAPASLVEALGMGSVRRTRGADPLSRGVASAHGPALPASQVTVAGRATRSAIPATAQRAAAQPQRHSATNVAPSPAGTSMGTVKRPTFEQLREIVSKLHMSMSDAEVAEYLEVIDGTLQAYDRSASCPTTCRRSPGRARLAIARRPRRTR